MAMLSRNLNQYYPPKLHISHTGIHPHVYALSTLTEDCSTCWKTDSILPESCLCKALIGNITFTNDSTDENVRVVVSSINGLLSIDPLDQTNVDFNSCTNRTRWKCLGSGSFDQEMIFLADPRIVGQVLSRITFQSFFPGPDSITITVYDGFGGDCPIESDETHSTSMCFSSSGIIPAYVRSTISQPQQFHALEVPTQAWIGLGGITMYGVFFLLYLINKWKSHKKMKQSLSDDEIDKNINFRCCSRKQRSHLHNGNNSNNSVGSLKSTTDTSKTSISKWLAYVDQKTGQTYFQDKQSRRVTWTEPREEYELVETVLSSSQAFGNNDDSGSDNDDNLSVTSRKIEYKSDLTSNDMSSPPEQGAESNSRWISFTDETSGDPYYMEKYTRRVTWTKPNEQIDSGD